jgi:hypothetical protein
MTSASSETTQNAAILRNHGVKVEEVSLPDEFSNADTLKRSQRVITNAEAKITFRRYVQFTRWHISHRGKVSQLASPSDQRTSRRYSHGWTRLIRSLVCNLNQPLSVYHLFLIAFCCMPRDRGVEK